MGGIRKVRERPVQRLPASIDEVMTLLSGAGGEGIPAVLDRLALPGQYLKRCTLELGGHAPFIVCDDVDVEAVATLGANLKFRNGGQICASPTRFYVQASVGF